MNNTNNIALLFREYEKSKERLLGRPQRTFLEVGKHPYYENTISNLLAFFLDPYETHYLQDLFLLSLFEIIEEKQGVQYHIDHSGDLQAVEIRREVVTEGNKRIDILVEYGDYVICIENKLDSTLNNPLKTYRCHVEQKYESGRRIPLFIVLSVRREHENISDGFINIQYADWFKKIKSNLHRLSHPANHKWLTFAVDFLETIEKRGDYDMDIHVNQDVIEKAQFFHENEHDIRGLFSLAEKLKRTFQGYAEKIHADYKNIQQQNIIKIGVWKFQTESYPMSSCYFYLKSDDGLKNAQGRKYDYIDLEVLFHPDGTFIIMQPRKYINREDNDMLIRFVSEMGLASAEEIMSNPKYSDHFITLRFWPFSNTSTADIKAALNMIFERLYGK